MKLIIGGAGQGKRQYAAETYHLSPEDFADCTEFQQEDFARCQGVCRFHQWVRTRLERGLTDESIAGEIEAILRVNPDILILLDEIGCGIVPMERGERIWRESVGRAGCLLAARAESVERVVCGCGVKIK